MPRQPALQAVCSNRGNRGAFVPASEAEHAGTGPYLPHAAEAGSGLDPSGVPSAG